MVHSFVLMVQNVVLTVAFIASHSFMASSLVKKLFQYFNVMPIYRAVYNLLAAVALQVDTIMLSRNVCYIILTNTLSLLSDLRTSQKLCVLSV